MYSLVEQHGKWHLFIVANRLTDEWINAHKDEVDSLFKALEFPGFHMPSGKPRLPVIDGWANHATSRDGAAYCVAILVVADMITLEEGKAYLTAYRERDETPYLKDDATIKAIKYNLQKRAPKESSARKSESLLASPTFLAKCCLDDIHEWQTQELI